MKNIMIWIMLLLSITYTDAQNGKSPRKDYAKLAIMMKVRFRNIPYLPY